MGMRSTFLLLALTAACAPAATPAPGTYTRPDLDALFRQAEPDFDPGPDQDGAFALHRAMPAYRALWAAVDRAEEHGLLELYGSEVFEAGEGTGYEALFFLRTKKGTDCVYANQDFHEARKDPLTVPTRRAPPDAFAKLRRRVAVEVPFPIVAMGNPNVLDGGYTAFHVFENGRSHAALWREPTFDPVHYREEIIRHRKEQPVLAVLGALWAAAPPELFPCLDENDDLPDDRKWEVDDLEVYGRAPAYE